MSVLVALCLFLTSTLAGLIQDVLGVVSARFDPLPEDVFRYRQHFGANLGSVFVLEKWMSPDMFDNGADKAELSAVAASVKRIGLKATRKRWEAHWDAAITDEDLDWLANTAHVSTIRLPFGYFDLGPSFCAGSPFEPYAQVYTNAWSKIIDVVHRAQNYGIGVLLDLHALRGGANKGEHSGTNFGKADLWASEGNLEFGRRCNEFIIQQFKDYKNIFALGIANEVDRGPKVYPWYDSVQQRISKIDSNIPIVISDGWDFDPAVKYASEKNRAINAEQNPIIVDTHQFWAFSDKDRASTPQDLIKRVSEKFRSRVDPTRRPAFPALVGEYSNVMNGNSLAQSGENSKDSLLARIGKVQASTYEASTGGSFYWAYKRNWTDGRDWDFATQVMAGHCPPPQHFLVSFDDVGAKLDAFNSARKANSSNQSQDSVQGRARQLGIADALAFYRMRSTGQLGRVKMGADRIGFLDFWMRKRILQTKVIASDIPAWQNSFREGVRYFEQNVGL